MTASNMFLRRMLLGALCALGVAMGGCEDTPPNEYVPQYVVETYLIVDQPMQGISLTRSQPLTDTFRVANGLVTDADVSLVADGRTYPLQYRAEGGQGGYFYPDTSELVKPNTLYKLEIRTKDGGHITAQTLTPGRVEWTKAPLDTITIPEKGNPAYLKPPDSLDLAWTPVPGVNEYLIRVTALDTLDYGKYLTPPTPELNRRVNPDFDEFEPPTRQAEKTRWGFVTSTKTPIVWAVFKWFGPQDVVLYAADAAFVRWFKMTQWTGNAQYDPLLGNVRGDGIGVFGSASVTRKKVFMKYGV